MLFHTTVVIQGHVLTTIQTVDPGYNRINMLAKIPELSLVIAASQAGLISLCTLTRSDQTSSGLGPAVSFHQDAILPLADQHAASHPPLPLLGIAVSPMPSSEGLDGKKNLRPRRWRLVVTYFDSSIVSYELSRGENDELWVI